MCRTTSEVQRYLVCQGVSHVLTTRRHQSRWASVNIELDEYFLKADVRSRRVTKQLLFLTDWQGDTCVGEKEPGEHERGRRRTRT